MKILVTGGAGYIGSHVVLKLCDLGYEVRVLDNLSLGDKRSVDSRAKFVEGSISDKNILSHALDCVNVVIHLAAFKSAGESMINPEKYSKNNILGTQILLDTMIEYEIKNIIFSSTAAVYGNPQYLPIDENHPKEPLTYYDLSIAISEIIQIPNTIFSNKNKNYFVGALGTNIDEGDLSLHHIILDSSHLKVINRKIYKVYDRIRDLKFIDTHKIVIMSLDNNAAIGVLDLN